MNMFRLLAFHNGRRLEREFLLVDGDKYAADSYFVIRRTHRGLHKSIKVFLLDSVRERAGFPILILRGADYRLGIHRLRDTDKTN